MAVIQQASGQFNGNGGFTPTLPAASSPSNTVVVAIAGNTVVATPSGWTLRTSQVNWMGHYLWDRTGGSAAYSFTANGQGTWWIAELSGTYNTALSANNTAAANIYTTPTLTPSAGNKTLIASIGNVKANDNARTTTFSDSFVESVDTYVPVGDYPLHALATREAPGGTAYSTAATASATSVGWSAIIAAYTSASATTPNQASAAGSVAITGAGTAKRTPKASRAGTITLAGTATAKATRRGAAAGTVTLAGTAASSRQPKATAAGTITITGMAAATAPTVGMATAQAAGTISLAGSAIARAARNGSAMGTIALTGTAAAKATRTAIAAGTITVGGAATGTIVPKAAAAGIISIAGTATGKITPQAYAVGNVTVTGSAAAVAPVVGGHSAQGAGQILIVGTASAQADRRAVGTGTITLAGSAQATAPEVGVANAQAIGTLNLTGQATAHRTPIATATGTITIAGATNAKAAHKAAGGGHLTIVGTANASNTLELFDLDLVGSVGETQWAASTAPAWTVDIETVTGRWKAEHMATTLQRETEEWLPVPVKHQGVPIIASVKFAILPTGTRPTAEFSEFTDAIVVEEQTGIMVTDLQPGDYEIWARVTTALERPVIRCGALRIA